MSEEIVNITYQLVGVQAAAFRALQDLEAIESNAEMARSLAIKQLREELKRHGVEIPGIHPNANQTSISAPRRRNAQQG